MLLLFWRSWPDGFPEHGSGKSGRYSADCQAYWQIKGVFNGPWAPAVAWQNPDKPGATVLGLRFFSGIMGFARETTSRRKVFARMERLPIAPEPEHCRARLARCSTGQWRGFLKDPGPQRLAGKTPASRAWQCSGLGSSRESWGLPGKPHPGGRFCGDGGITDCARARALPCPACQTQHWIFSS